MKRFLGIVLIVLIVVWLTSCGGVTTNTTNVEKSEGIIVEDVETEEILVEEIIVEEIKVK